MKNESKWEEERLRSWIPRTPSPDIERRLFGSAEPAHQVSLSRLWWRGFAPATVVCLLALMLLPSQLENWLKRETAGVASEPIPMTLALSNANPVASMLAVNVWVNPVGAENLTSLEWTNPVASPSTIPFVLRSQATNSLY